MLSPLLRTGLRAAVTGGLLATMVFGQGKGGGSTGGATGGVGGGNTGNVGTIGNRTPATNTNSLPGNRPPDFSSGRVFYVSGKVMMEDGNPPSDLVAIERVCGGRTYTEGYTDRKGRFSVELGKAVNQLADASNSDMGGRSQASMIANPGMSSVSEQSLFNCEIRASLSGYRSASVNLAGRKSLDNPEIGTLFLKRIGGDKVEGFTISLTNALAPKDAKKEYDKGVELGHKGKSDEAVSHFEKAVAVYPKYASAWLSLGLLQEGKGEKEAAMKSYQESINADAKFVPPYVQLSGLAAKEKKWQEANDFSAKALKLDPFGFPMAYMYHAVACLNTGNPEDAEKSAREGIKIDTERRAPALEHILGVILAQKNELTESAEHLQTYLKLAPNANNAKIAREQLEKVQLLIAQK